MKKILCTRVCLLSLDTYLYGGEGRAKVWVVTYRQYILVTAVFICYIGVEDQFLGVIIKHFSFVIEFTVVGPLDVREFPIFLIS